MSGDPTLVKDVEIISSGIVFVPRARFKNQSHEPWSNGHLPRPLETTGDFLSKFQVELTHCYSLRGLENLLNLWWIGK